MKQKLKAILQYLFFLSLGGLLIWYSSKDLNKAQIQQLQHSFAEAKYLYLLPVMVALLISDYARALRWIILIKPLGKAPSLKNTFLIVMIGYFLNLIIPRLGEIMKCTLLARYEKIPANALFGTIVAERAMDVLCLLLFIALMMATQYELIGQFTITYLQTHFGDKLTLQFGIKIALLFILFGAAIWIFWRFVHSNPQAKISRMLASILEGLWHGFTSIRSIKEGGWFVFHTFIIWLMYLLAIWFGFLAFPAVANIQWGATISILVFGSFGMMLTQGGIGAYQFAVQKTLVVYSINEGVGLAFGWVLWGAQTAFVLVSGILSFLLLTIINQKKHEKQ